MSVVSIATAPSFKPAPIPQIEYTYRDLAGAVRKKRREWKLPETPSAIAAWMGKYFEMVANGYVPEGFTVAPRPISARIKVGRKVVAEWRLDVEGYRVIPYQTNLKDGLSRSGVAQSA